VKCSLNSDLGRA